MAPVCITWDTYIRDATLQVVANETDVVEVNMVASAMDIIIADADLLGVCADPGSPVRYVELYR